MAKALLSRGGFSHEDIGVLGLAVAMLGLFMFAPESAEPRLPELASLEPAEKKTAFFEFLRPVVAAANAEVRRDRARLGAIENKLEQGVPLSWFDQGTLDALVDEYEIDIEADATAGEIVAALDRHIGVVPESLALVQAAKESGWGTSRFAVEGNNLYGQRCYEAGCGLKPRSRPNASFGVARFESVAESVRSYIRNLNTHPDYAAFRELRRRLREAGEPLTGLKLAEALGEYSERGQAYVAEIKSLIRNNGLEPAQ